MTKRSILISCSGKSDDTDNTNNSKGYKCEKHEKREEFSERTIRAAFEKMSRIKCDKGKLDLRGFESAVFASPVDMRLGHQSYC